MLSTDFANIKSQCGQQMEPPLVKFQSQDEYAHRLEKGTQIEMQNELSQLKKLNDRGESYPAWVVAPIPGCQTSFSTSWLLLARSPPSSTNIIFPTVADRFHIDIDASIVLPQGVYTLYHLPATRIQNPYEDVAECEGKAIQKLAAFKVDVPRCQTTEDGEQVPLDLMSHIKVADAVGDFSGIKLDDASQKNISIRWDVVSQTFEAELDALYAFIVPKRHKDQNGPSYKARLAFGMIQQFCTADLETSNLLKKYPLLPTRTTVPTRSHQFSWRSLPNSTWITWRPMRGLVASRMAFTLSTAALELAKPSGTWSFRGLSNHIIRRRESESGIRFCSLLISIRQYRTLPTDIIASAKRQVLMFESYGCTVGHTRCTILRD